MSAIFYETRHFIRHGRLLRATLVGDEPWFAARDLGRLLGISANVRMNEGLDPDQWRSGLIKCGRGLAEEQMLISESGSYDLLLRRFYHPENRNLRRWLTHEVIPELRAARRAA
ncbi:BRO-N domain-containing protein [Pseudomonas sp. Q1-7]|uniref:BRO-N domain-containing protein n=1 Tax=Pseudomonas sp. Q1-7 TaxID=3020843 RepID=UPI0023002B20|nr:Bro-N domain-containing protein [Pseudomonas sp. Q1-7]